MVLSPSFFENRRLETLVENQTSYSLQHAEMHVFETHQQAERVLLEFNYPVLASMLQGKKIMHLQKMDSFDFLPGESLVLPPGELMCIDFPEARDDNPTRCLAMTMSEDKIREIVHFLNENHPKEETGNWNFTSGNFHFTNDLAIHQIIKRLLFIFTENHPSKDIFADFMLRELIIRILQTEVRENTCKEALFQTNNNRLHYIINYIKNNLDHPLTIEELSKKACMSESNFHRVFKNELGISPIDFLINERIKLATSLLHNRENKIKDVYLQCGFNSLSYFIRLFKKKKQMSPKAYQQIVNPAIS